MFEAYLLRKRARYFLKRVWRKLTGASGKPSVYDPASLSVIPRKLWLYWAQGFDNAPELVKRCVQTWQELNPGWDIQLIDARNLNSLVAMPDLPKNISHAHRADVLRTLLLNKHGGVWADPTTWCLRPLDEWLPIAAQTGFFVFTWPRQDRALIEAGPSRILGNWFIAAAPGNPLVREWDRLTQAYWEGRQKTDLYFWHNDAVEYILRQGGEATRVWDVMPKLSAARPHVVWNALENGGDENSARKVVEAGGVPLLKLSWRMQTSVADVERVLEQSEADLDQVS